MAKVKVGVAGYGVIGQRLADGVARQKDMELVGVADVAPTLAVRALYEKTHVRIPKGLKDLDKKPVLHTGVLDIDQMAQAVKLLIHHFWHDLSMIWHNFNLLKFLFQI